MFTVVELAAHPVESGNLAARHNLVEIAEACRRESDDCTIDGIRLATVAARLLASPILQEYATFKSGAKGLKGGCERIPAGCGRVILRSGLAALVTARRVLAGISKWKQLEVCQESSD